MCVGMGHGCSRMFRHVLTWIPTLDNVERCCWPRPQGRNGRGNLGPPLYDDYAVFWESYLTESAEKN